MFEGHVARFAITGIACAALQIALVAALDAAGSGGFAANAVAFALAAQLNFVLSSRFTWGDRRPGGSMSWRWLVFLGAISGTAALNLGVFALAQPLLGDVRAAALGIAAAAIVNFLVGDRAIFRPASIERAPRVDTEARRTPEGAVRG